MGYPPHSLPSKIRLKRALLSCYDKAGLEFFGTTLSKEAGVELIASEGTAEHLKNAKLDTTPIETITNFPELPRGLVKTLHPKIHAMILAEINISEEIVNKLHEIKPIDLVACNLYPFKKTVIKQSSIEACRSQIDIGGHALIRAAAKNYPRVAILTNPDQYEPFLKQIEKQDWCTTLKQRFQLAVQAFKITSEYDTQIVKYFEFTTYQRLKQFYLIEKNIQ